MADHNLNIYLNDSGEVRFDLFDMIKYLPEEKQNEIAEFLSWELILEHLDRHLKGESVFESWDTSGYRGGAKVREHIEKVQGTRDQRIEDLETKIRSLERSEKHYKTYYDWYFKFYHNDFETFNRIENRIGKPEGK